MNKVLFRVGFSFIRIVTTSNDIKKNEKIMNKSYLPDKTAKINKPERTVFIFQIYEIN